MHTHSSGVLPNFPNTSWISVIIFHLLLGEALSMLSGKRLSTLYYSSVLLSIPGDQSSYWPRCETSSRQWRTTQQNNWRRGSHPRLKRLETGFYGGHRGCDFSSTYSRSSLFPQAFKQKSHVEPSVLEPELPCPRIRYGREKSTELNTRVEITFLPPWVKTL
jgi:hypothetical protein